MRCLEKKIDDIIIKNVEILGLNRALSKNKLKKTYPDSNKQHKKNVEHNH